MKVVHEHNFIHRDIKPDNFMIGDNWNSRNQVFIIDFGLAMRWKDDETGEHNPYVENVDSCGTWRYDSINSMNHVTTSRRDDMISIGYMLIYFMRGEKGLPW